MEWQILAWSRLADAAAGGLIVLAAGSLAARLCRQPVRRARLVVLTLLGGMAVPGLGALPVAPRWSAGLLRGAGRDPRSRRPCSPRRAQAADSTRPRRPDRESPSGPSSSPERRRRAHARTGPALAPIRAGGVRARGAGGISPPRGRFCSGVTSRWRPGWRPGGSSDSSCSGG